MKANRWACRVDKRCTRAVGTTCSRCGILACSKHSVGVGGDRVCLNCLAEKREPPR